MIKMRGLPFKVAQPMFYDRLPTPLPRRLRWRYQSGSVLWPTARISTSSTVTTTGRVERSGSCYSSPPNLLHQQAEVTFATPEDARRAMTKHKQNMGTRWGWQRQ